MPHPLSQYDQYRLPSRRKYAFRGVTIPISRRDHVQHHVMAKSHKSHNGITARANKMLGLIRHNLRGTSQKLRQQTYISLVHPHLEYCCTVWNPHTRKEVTKNENIQRRAARFSNNYGQRESVSTTWSTAFTGHSREKTTLLPPLDV